jgi:hypothetical protein
MNKGFIACLAALGAIAFSSLVHAQTTLECGNVACFGNERQDPVEWLLAGTATGIDDIVVDGDAFNVAFTHTLPSSSPFVFSYDAAAPGQPLTGVDAANALQSFLRTQLEANSTLAAGGPGILTAYQYNPTTGQFLFDADSTFFSSVYSPYTPVSIVPNEGPYYPNLPVAAYEYTVSTNSNVCPVLICTVWTPINANAAPEISPASALSALTLLLGSILVLRGWPPGQLAA